MDSPKALKGGALIPEPGGGRVLLAGDIHGDADWWHRLCIIAVEQGCDTIAQMGDFGFWPPDLDRWLGPVTWLLEEHGLTARVLDGNHDWHGGVRHQFPADASGVRPLYDGVLDWADRGARWKWGGHRFAALGGAVSIDQDQRTKPGPGVPESRASWWPTEAVTREEAERVIDGGPVDVLLTHDAPYGFGPAFAPLPTRLQIPVDASRQQVSAVMRATKPQLLVHGHLHVRYSDETRVGDDRWCRIEGIASNIEGDGRAWAVLDLADLSVSNRPVRS